MGLFITVACGGVFALHAGAVYYFMQGTPRLLNDATVALNNVPLQDGIEFTSVSTPSNSLYPAGMPAPFTAACASNSLATALNRQPSERFCDPAPGCNCNSASFRVPPGITRSQQAKCRWDTSPEIMVSTIDTIDTTRTCARHGARVDAQATPSCCCPLRPEGIDMDNACMTHAYDNVFN